jgi:hypothetical protein
MTRTRTAVALCVVVAGLSACWSALRPTAAAQDKPADSPAVKWEYKFVYISEATAQGVEKTLNAAGENGWEVSGPVPSPHGEGQLRYLMKRPKR